MDGSSPKLVKVTATSFGAVLSLSDGEVIPVNVTPEKLEVAIQDQCQITLTDLVARHSCEVFSGQWELDADNWRHICDCIAGSSLAQKTLQPLQEIWRVFSQSIGIVQEMPHRVYGGIKHHALYTSHPFLFQPINDKPGSWFRGLLSASEGRLFQTWVDLDECKVEIEVAQRKGHFIE